MNYERKCIYYILTDCIFILEVRPFRRSKTNTDKI